MRVAVVDIGSNSTRLLVADVDEGTGAVQELDRRTKVTRLGQGVDATGTLAEDAIARVLETLDAYHEVIVAEGCERAVAVLTSAVRDASNGAQFAEAVRGRYGLDARTIAGEEEARLVFAGATSERDRADRTPLVVIDIGGGSTEFICGTGGEVTFSTSTQAGVVRHGERHLHHDPPQGPELQALADDVRGVFAAALPEEARTGAQAAIAVAGTATSLAAIDLELDPYDPNRVHGHVLALGRCEELLARLADMDLERRRRVVGLHPDRAPTIVAGVVILVEALRAFGLDRVEVSEHDILRGSALAAARGRMAD